MRSGSEAPAYASASVLTVDEMWSRPMLSPERYSVATSQRGGVRREFADRGGLGDGDVIEGAECSEDHAGEDEASEIDVGDAHRDEQRVFVLRAGEVRECGEQRRESDGEDERGERAEERDGGHGS